MKNRRDLIRAFRSARISRREFVERAAQGTLGLTATLSVLSATAHSQSNPPASAHPPGPAQDHSHAYGKLAIGKRPGAAEILSQEFPLCPLGSSEERNAGWMLPDVIEAT